MTSLKKLAAPALAVVLAAVASVPWLRGPDDSAAASAAAGLSFERHGLPAGTTNRHMRDVAPDLETIRPWISAVGSSVGVMDLRGQGAAGDGCTTDPRDDTVRVFSIPDSAGTPFPTFELAPDGLPYDATMAPIGCVPSDINQDGHQDIVVYYWGRSPIVFVNDGKGDVPKAATFSAHELVAPMEVWNTTALAVADVDGDGLLDILVGNYFPDGARVLDTAAEDDPRMEMQHSMGKARNAGANRLYLGQPVEQAGEMPKFANASIDLPATSAAAWTLAFGLQDLSGNGLMDAYVANDFGPDQLLVNKSTPGHVLFDTVEGRRDFTTARSKTLGHDSFKGMGVTFSYEEGESLPRIFVSNITSPWALQESNLAFVPQGRGEDLLEGRVPYDERSATLGIAHSGWSWDVKALDLRNSGEDCLAQVTGFIQGERDIWPRLQETAMGNDLILSHPGAWLRIKPGDDLSGHETNKLWCPTSSGKYADVGQRVPFEDDEVSRGIAPGDFDRDGRRDFLVAGQWQPSYAYLNRSKAGRAITLEIVRPAKVGDQTTPLVGATVVLKGDTGYWRKAQIYPTNGHSGVAAPDVHFGIPHDEEESNFTAKVSWIDAGRRHTTTFPVKIGHQTIEVY